MLQHISCQGRVWVHYHGKEGYEYVGIVTQSVIGVAAHIHKCLELRALSAAHHEDKFGRQYEGRLFASVHQKLFEVSQKVSKIDVHQVAILAYHTGICMCVCVWRKKEKTIAVIILVVNIVPFVGGIAHMLSLWRSLVISFQRWRRVIKKYRIYKAIIEKGFLTSNTENIGGHYKRKTKPKIKNEIYWKRDMNGLLVTVRTTVASNRFDKIVNSLIVFFVCLGEDLVAVRVDIKAAMQYTWSIVWAQPIRQWRLFKCSCNASCSLKRSWNS